MAVRHEISSPAPCQASLKTSVRLSCATDSGKGAAEACAAKERGLCARILADPTSDPTDPVSIEQAFWDADAEIGTAGERSGTTATVLVCAPHASGVRCTLAWVGDSSAVHFDVSPNKTCRLEGRIHHTTVDHSPKMSKEVAFLNHLCDLRDAIDVGAASVDAAARQVRAREPTADDLRVFGRAIDRKWLIAKTLDPAGKSARRRAIVMKRAGKNSKGKASKTTVVATAEDSSDPHYYDLASAFVARRQILGHHRMCPTASTCAHSPSLSLTLTLSHPLSLSACAQ